jgi:NleD-like pathogen effector protein (putative zinc metallopeptidase)
MEDRGSRIEDSRSRIEDGRSRIEDRRWKIEDRITKFNTIFDPRSSILDPRWFDGVGGRDRSVIARRIVAASSVEDLRRLAAESRHRLREELSLGYAPVKEREALEKILAADLLEKIPAAELVVVEYQRGIVIKGAKGFVGKAQSHLDQIARVPTGGRLLRSIASRGLAVTLVPSSRVNEARPDNYRAAVAQGKSLRWRDEAGRNRVVRGSGVGSNTTIKYNPDLLSIGSFEAWQRQPPAIWLAHELIHADDAAYGRMDPEVVDCVRNYERQAIGLPPYEMKEFTENRLRAEWGEPQPARPRY